MATRKIDPALAARYTVIMMSTCVGRPYTRRRDHRRRAACRHRRFLSLTILKDVATNSPIAHEEIIGPVTPVDRFETEDETIRPASTPKYGLVAYIYTADLKLAMRVGKGIEFGMLGIKRGLMSAPAAPFDSIKRSGNGRKGGVIGIMEFFEAKCYAVEFKAGGGANGILRRFCCKSFSTVFSAV